MRLSNFLKSVLMIWISSTFLPVISKMPSTLYDNSDTFSDNISTLSDNPSTLSRRADRPSPNILKSERNDSRITVNSLSLFRLWPLFINSGSLTIFCHRCGGG